MGDSRQSRQLYLYQKIQKWHSVVWKKHSRDYKNANFEFDLNNHDRNAKLFQRGFCTTNIKEN